MWKSLLFAVILAGILAEDGSGCPDGRCPRPSQPMAQGIPDARIRKSPARLPAVGEQTVRVTRTTIRVPRHLPPPVAAPPIERSGVTVVEGVIPNIIQAPDPIQMLNPLAPPEYGSARNFVVYTDQDPYSMTTITPRFQPEGIRLLTVRPLW